MRFTRYQQSPSSRSRYGGSIIEIGISAFLLAPLAAIGVDLTLMMLGITLTDTACRDAARAAAQQSTPAKASQAAQSQLQLHGTDGYWISQPVLTAVVYNDFAGSPPVNVSPYVTVTITTTVRCPAPIFFFGADFVKGGVLQFSRSYTFPIIKETFYG
jgi:Flp pilus assembly protein TadG